MHQPRLPATDCRVKHRKEAHLQASQIQLPAIDAMAVQMGPNYVAARATRPSILACGFKGYKRSLAARIQFFLRTKVPLQMCHLVANGQTRNFQVKTSVTHQAVTHQAQKKWRP